MSAVIRSVIVLTVIVGIVGIVVFLWILVRAKAGTTVAREQ